MNKTPNSGLSRRILLTLNLKPADSIAALARDLEALRPSVSRSVNALLETGLINREGRILSLTQTGQEEVRYINAELNTKVKKTTDQAARVLNEAYKTWKIIEPGISTTMQTIQFTQFTELSQIMNAFENLPGKQLVEAFEHLPSKQIMNAFENLPGKQLVEAFEHLPSKQIMNAFENLPGKQLVEAINATAQIQTINLDWLQNWHSDIPNALNHVLVENNAFISSILTDLDAISSAISNVNITLDYGLENFVSLIAETATSYDAYFKEVAHRFSSIPTLYNLQTTLSIPTTATASIVGSARYIVGTQTALSVEQQTQPESAKVLVHSERYVAISPILIGYLEPLGVRFVNKWEGAWQTLHSGSSDRYSQATHSGRELLMQVLAELAPDEAFSKEECLKHNVSKPSRKMRIKYILGSNNQHIIDLIDNMANMLDTMYHLLTGEAHRRDDKDRYDDTIAGELAALGGLLITLLSQRFNSHQ